MQISFENKKKNLVNTLQLRELSNLLSLKLHKPSKRCRRHWDFLVEALFVRNGIELTDSIQCNKLVEYFDQIKEKILCHV